jgi:hypothetical protein
LKELKSMKCKLGRSEEEVVSVIVGNE